MRNFLQKLPKWLRILITVVVVGFLAAVFAYLSWVITDEGLNRTSHAEFCAQCHTMKPFWAAYEKDIHGGASEFGVQASCTNCHLDNSSSSAYFISKAVKGLHDLRVEWFTDTSQIDWEAMRERREEYTYDSGCLSCHGNLLEATKRNHKAYLPHKEYFSGETDKHCVSCHKHVGHQNMSYYIANPDVAY